MTRRIDLNADLGESFGAWTQGQDADLLKLVTSANIACGFHGGDPGVMADTVSLAVARGVAIGAHPGWPDLQGFGRRSMAVSPRETHDLVLYQLGALAAFAKAAGTRLAHLKPHGALYHQAAADSALAEAVAAAVRAFDPGLILVGPADSCLIRAGQVAGLAVAREGFADRRYEADGSLTPRTRPDALIHDDGEALAQVLSMIERGELIARDGTLIPMPVDTLCIHGDNPRALALARRLRRELEDRGISVAPVRGIIKA